MGMLFYSELVEEQRAARQCLNEVDESVPLLRRILIFLYLSIYFILFLKMEIVCF